MENSIKRMFFFIETFPWFPNSSLFLCSILVSFCFVKISGTRSLSGSLKLSLTSKCFLNFQFLPAQSDWLALSDSYCCDDIKNKLQLQSFMRLTPRSTTWLSRPSPPRSLTWFSRPPTTSSWGREPTWKSSSASPCSARTRLSPTCSSGTSKSKGPACRPTGFQS